MSNKRIIDLEDSNQLDLNDYLALYNAEPTADNHTFKRKISDVLALKTVSVNGKTGNTITINADDISDVGTTKKFTTTAEKSKVAVIKTDLGANVVLCGDGQYRLQTSNYSGGTTVISVSTTTSITTSANYVVLCNTTSAGFTVNLPAIPTDKQSIRIKDAAGQAGTSTKHITVSGGSTLIEGSVTGTINSAYGSVELMYSTAVNQWVILSMVI